MFVSWTCQSRKDIWSAHVIWWGWSCTDPNDPGLAKSQGNGFYMGVAYWPGGRIKDWGATLNATTGIKGLNPCTTNNNFNKSGISDRAYLV